MLNDDLNESKFSRPLPWIGVYVVFGNTVCALAMAADVFNGFRQLKICITESEMAATVTSNLKSERKLWFNCKYFSLNAFTLALIGIAIKFSVDLNTPMPRKQDQLTKLSSSAFICAVMANFHPSIGTMQNKEILANIMALVILVITAIVNICIQLGTGVIYTFWPEHVILMSFMLVLLAILCSSALVVPTTKCYLERKYTEKHEIAMMECSDDTEKCISEKLRCDLNKFWMMANTCEPQFVIMRSVTGAASAIIGILSVATLAEATLRAFLKPPNHNFYNSDSDYKWSINLVLVSQVVAVVVGTLGPAYRWNTTINFRGIVKASNTSKQRFKVESYWIQVLVDWKETPIAFEFCGRRGKKFANAAKVLVLVLCIHFQIGVVKVIKWLAPTFDSVTSITQLFSFLFVNDDDLEMGSQPGSELHHLSSFILYLEGEDEMVKQIVKDNQRTADHWLSRGKNTQPENLLNFFQKYPSTQNLGVSEFDSNQVPSLHDQEEPPNCWALPIVTLTTIAIALPRIDNHSIKQLVRSVSEGLTFVRIVQNNLNNTREHINAMKTAESLWLKVELYHRWLDTDLKKIALQNESPEKVLEQLVAIAKRKFEECQVDVSETEHHSRWPVKALAANSMYRISSTILSDSHESSEKLFEKLSLITADILAACLKNLATVIPMECNRSTIEKREESVRHAIVLLGKADNILKSLKQQTLPNLGHIDEWRLLSQLP